jgi:hypothetical protein
MFGQRHRLRHIAAQVLLVWLFALAAGIVNACVLEPELRHGIASAVHDGHDAAAANKLQDAHAPGGHDHRLPHGNEAPCAKFCDEPSAGAQTFKQQIDPFNAVWLAPAPVSSLSIDATTPVVGAFAADHELWRPAVPIPIAFLRLTL